MYRHNFNISFRGCYSSTLQVYSISHNHSTTCEKNRREVHYINTTENPVTCISSGFQRVKINI